MGNRKQPTPVPKGAVKPVPPPAPPIPFDPECAPPGFMPVEVSLGNGCEGCDALDTPVCGAIYCNHSWRPDGREVILRKILTKSRSNDAVVESLCKQDADVLRSIIGKNSERHGGHVEWQSRTPQYHLQKVIRHAATAMAQLDLNEEIKDGEDAIDHVERVVVRASMALAQLNKYMKEG